MYLTFIRSWIVFSLVGLALVAVLNFAVDPYDVFGMPRVEGFNAIKASIGPKVRMAEIHQVIKARPKAIVIGNSRPEIGLNPDHPCWPKENQPVYNAAIPGLSVYGQVRYGQHAMASGEIGLILIGLDFIDYLVPPDVDRDPGAWPVAALEPKGLRTDANGRQRTAFFWDRLKDQISATISLDALKDTSTTLIQQKPGTAITRTPLGFNPGQPIFGPTIRHEGARLLFTQKNRMLAEQLSAKPWSLVHRRTSWSSNFEALKRLFVQGKAKGIRIVPFINPLHADFLILIDQAGLWPLMEVWKRRIAAIAANNGAAPVWDFNSFDDHATESVDDVALKGESLRWFWEPSHYRQALGDRMLSTMLAKSCPGDDARWTLGVAATPANIARHSSMLRADRDDFKASNRQHVDDLAGLIDKYRRATAKTVAKVSKL